MSLPVSATHVDDRYFIDLRRRGVPFRMRHEERDIDPLMDDLVYNLIDIIQDEADRSDLRCFFANIMSDRDWDNRDFNELATNAGYWVGIGLRSGRFRDEREAFQRGVEEFVQVASAAMVDTYPELERHIDRDMMGRIDKACRVYNQILDEIDRYRNGGRRDRDYRGERDRDRGRDRYNDRGRRDDRDDRRRRRDQYDRSGITGYRGTSPDRDDNRYAGADQSDRFADANAPVVASNKTSTRENLPEGQYAQSRSSQAGPRNRSNDRESARRDRPDDSRSAQNTGRYPFTPPDIDNTKTRTDMSAPTLTEQTLDAFDNAMPEGTKVLPVDKNLDMYAPSLEDPHPSIWGSKSMLYLALTPGAKSFNFISGANMDYNRHHSLAFGDLPKELDRYRDDEGTVRANMVAKALREPLYTLDEPNPEGADKPAIQLELERVGKLQDHNVYAMGVGEIFTSMQILHTWANTQAKGKSEKAEPIHAFLADGFTLTAFCTSEAERRVVDDIRQAQSYYKVIEILKGSANVLTPGNWRLLDEYFAAQITRILKHCLSTKLAITTLVGDFKDLLELLEKDYGEAYRQFLLEKQAQELSIITNHDVGCNGYFDTRFVGADLFSPSIFSIPVSVLYVNALSFDLGIDTIPDVGCQITAHASRDFDSIVKSFVTDGSNKRRYIMTADHRILEIANSYVHEPTLLVRVVK